MISSYIRDLKNDDHGYKMLSLERTSVDKMTRGCLEDDAIVHLIILLLVIILGRLDLFLLHLLGLLLALAVQLGPAVHLINLSIQVRLLEVDVSLGLLLRAFLRGLSLHELHPDHGEDEN